MNEEATRRRRLSKYEAAAPGDAVAPFETLQPFGPLIGRCALPAALVEGVNRFADTQLAGKRGGEFILPQPFVFAPGASLGGWIEAQIRHYVEAAEGAPPHRVRLEAVWIVSQYAGAASPMHFHSGDVSGVAYLATPELAAEAQEGERNYISGRQAGYLNFLTGGKQRFAKSLLSVKPRVGDAYVFPGWLLHGVEPFRGTGERRSLAFNAYVDAAEA